MSLVLKEDTYVHGFWFADRPGQNWMGCVLRQPGENWEFTYRFRYFKDERIFDNEDHFSWTTLKWKDPEDPQAEAGLVAAAESLAEMLVAVGYTSEVDRILVQGLGAEATDKLSEAPWAHKRTEKVKDCE